LLLGIPLGAVGLWALVLYLGRPVKYRHLDYDSVQDLLCSFAKQLNDRGRIYLTHTDVSDTLEIQKHARKVKPSLLLWRYRNTENTRAHFHTVVTALEDAGVALTVELTPRRKNPRAIKVEFELEDEGTYEGLASISRLVFEVLGATQGGRLVVFAKDTFPRPSSKGTGAC